MEVFRKFCEGSAEVIPHFQQAYSMEFTAYLIRTRTALGLWLLFCFLFSENSTPCVSFLYITTFLSLQLQLTDYFGSVGTLS